MEKDVFDYIDEEDETKPPDRSGLVWNILTILVLLTTVCVGILFITIFITPNAGFNPFPPPPVPERMELATPTPTPKSILPPTWTPVASSTPTQTSVQSPENTPLPTEEGQVSDDDQGEDQEILGDMPVVLHEGNPQYIPATSFHPDLGCNWMGVAGQVIDVNGAPVQGLIIEVGGTLGGRNIGNPTILQATGLATAYGEAGYEVKLADQPVDTTGTLWIQVLDQAALPLSEKIYFYTFEDCEKNLVIIYFKQIR
jgi:hypothetical protein